MSFCVVTTTCPDQESATTIASHLVEAGLAACVQLMPNIQSFYTWQDKVEQSKEVKILIKTTLAKQPLAQQWVLANHPYECPEWVVIPFEQGATGYLGWIQEMTAD